MINDQANEVIEEVIEELLESLIIRYQNNLEKSMTGTVL